MSAFWNRAAYYQRRHALRHELRTAKYRSGYEGYVGENARRDAARCREALQLIDLGIVTPPTPNYRLKAAIIRNKNLVQQRLHKEQVARELPLVREAAKAAGLGKMHTALAELAVSWGGKTAKEAMA